MSTDNDKATVRRFYTDALDDGNLDAIDEIAVEDYIENGMVPGQGTGRQGLKDRVTILRNAFAPRFTLEDVIAEGDRVVVRWKNHCTHVGEFMGIPPTGKPYSIDGIDIYRLENGKMAEHWHVVDQLSMLQQIGVLPSAQG
jgi:steroid delta-isomerase-like uncharacterized protein